MPMVHLNQCPNKGVIISRINGRTKTITWLPVHLGEAMLCLGGAKISQEGVLGSPRRIDLRLCEGRWA